MDRNTQKFGRAHRYRPSAGDVARFVPLPKEKGHRVFAQENGWGVAAELQDLFQGSKSERESFNAVENAVKQLFPHIKSIGFKSDWQGVRLTYVTNRSQDPIPAPSESDGVLLSTFLFWRLFTGSASMKVCLEEPENGLHAFLLAHRFKILKMFAYGGGDGPRSQILVATHSPEFLRQLNAHKKDLMEELRCVEFSEGAGTSVKGISFYPEVGKLHEQYLNRVHEEWEPIVKKLTKGAGE